MNKYDDWEDYGELTRRRRQKSWRKQFLFWCIAGAVIGSFAWFFAHVIISVL